MSILNSAPNSLLSKLEVFTLSNSSLWLVYNVTNDSDSLLFKDILESLTSATSSSGLDSGASSSGASPVSSPAVSLYSSSPVSSIGSSTFSSWTSSSFNSPSGTSSSASEKGLDSENDLNELFTILKKYVDGYCSASIDK